MNSRIYFEKISRTTLVLIAIELIILQFEQNIFDIILLLLTYITI